MIAQLNAQPIVIAGRSALTARCCPTPVPRRFALGAVRQTADVRLRMTWRAPVMAGFLAVGLARAVIACDCLIAAGYTDKNIESVLAQAEAVVHAKVLSLTTDREAQIMIYESFKGQPTVLRAQSADQDCGTGFRVGEEAIYIVYSGQVGLCGRLPAHPDLLRRLREHKR